MKYWLQQLQCLSINYTVIAKLSIGLEEYKNLLRSKLFCLLPLNYRKHQTKKKFSCY